MRKININLLNYLILFYNLIKIYFMIFPSRFHIHVIVQTNIDEKK